MFVTERVRVTFFVLGGERRPGSIASTSLILSTRIGLVVVADLLATVSPFGLTWSARQDNAIKARINGLYL